MLFWILCPSLICVVGDETCTTHLPLSLSENTLFGTFLHPETSHAHFTYDIELMSLLTPRSSLTTPLFPSSISSGTRSSSPSTSLTRPSSPRPFSVSPPQLYGSLHRYVYPPLLPPSKETCPNRKHPTYLLSHSSIPHLFRLCQTFE